MKYYYVGLLKSSCFGLIEPARDTNYRRIEITPMDWYSEACEGDVILNAVKIEFPIALNDWGRITHFGFFDSLRNGNLIIVGAILCPSPPIKEGNTIRFDVGNLQVSLKELGINING